MSTAIAIFSAVVAAISAVMAVASWLVASDTARRQLRAYLTVDALEIVGVAAGQRPTVKLRFVNMGPTPALDVTHESTLQLFDFPLDGPLKLPTHAQARAKGNVVSVVVGKSVDLQKQMARPLTAPECAEVRGGGAIRLYAAGKVFYKDIFGRRRETAFQYMYWGANIDNMFGVMCETGNSIS